MLEVTQKVLEIDPVSFQPVIKVTIKIPVSSTMDAHLQGLITHEQIGKELCEKIAAA